MTTTTAPSIAFDLATRRLVFGMRPCTMCGNRNGDHPHAAIPAGRSVVFPDKPCTGCKGTGRRGNGRCRACREPFGRRPAGMVADYANPQVGGVCGSCDGAGEVPATMTDALPAETLAEVLAVCPIRIYARDRDLSGGERLFGMVPASTGLHSIEGCQDYGRAWDLVMAGGADELRARIAERLSHVQACKIADASGLVDDHIGVLLARDGYSLVGVPAPVAETATGAL